MSSVKVGQLRSWNNIENFHFIVIRLGPDNSEPGFTLATGEAELMYPSRPHERHMRQLESIWKHSQLLEDPC